MPDIRSLTQNQFIRSSGLVLIGSTLANVLNYLFNLVMGRMLDPIAYGELAALVTLAMIVVVPSLTISNLTTKLISEHKARGEENLVPHTIRQGTYLGLKIGIVLLIAFWILTPWLAGFFKIDKFPIFIFSVLLPLSMIGATAKGALQGLQNFKGLAISTVIEAIFKLLVAIVFVYMGYSVSGAIGGLLAGTILAFIYSFIKLRPAIGFSNTKNTETEYSLSHLPGYTKLVFFTNLFLAVFGNVDVVLAKHYLSEADAGQYAALAVLGRIVTYASIAVITVMLPMAAASHASGGRSERILKLAMALTAVVSGVILLFFFGIPEWTIKQLFGANYLSIASYLGVFGLIMFLGSLSKILINYFLAIHQQKFIYFFGLITILQLVSIFFVHGSISQFIVVLLSTNILLLGILAVVYLLTPNQKELNV